MNSGIKANTQNSIVFLYTVVNLKRKLQNNSIYKSTKKIPLRNKFTKEMEDLYNGNYKTVVKEIKDINKWKDIIFSWIGRLKIVKIVILLKGSTDPKQFLQTQNKHMSIFCRNLSANTKIYMEMQAWIIKTMWKNIKICYYKAMS